MAGRLGIDFGTSNTVIALWNDSRKEAEPRFVVDYGFRYKQGEEQVPVVPSLIHYAPQNRRYYGGQVQRQNLYSSPNTFRLMKHYIMNRSPSSRNVNNTKINFFEAGKDFLSNVLLFATRDLEISNEEVAFTVPVNAFEEYTNWLTDVAEKAGMPRFRLIDEASAAALGYGSHIQPGNVYLVFDFGGGTLDVAVVLIEEDKQATMGQRCRVLGKAGAQLGGSTIDGWLFEEVLRQNERKSDDEDINKISNELLSECEKLKEQLSRFDRSDFTITDPDTGATLAAEFTRTQFEDLLDRNDAFTIIDRAIRSALNKARERGYSEDTICNILMVGGSSLIPSIQRSVQRIFGRDKVMLHRPLDAVARGAAAFVAGVDFYDHIQHDYALRYINRQTGNYEYTIIVQSGTAYPTTQPVAKKTIKASYNGQTQLGLALFEIGERRSNFSASPIELVFDPSGAPRAVHITPQEEEERYQHWLNENQPTFLTATQPVIQGEPRFDVEFNIDGNKHLTITVRDLKTRKLTHRDFPVVKLT